MENFFLWAGGGGAVCTAHSRLSSTRRNASQSAMGGGGGRRSVVLGRVVGYHIPRRRLQGRDLRVPAPRALQDPGTRALVVAAERRDARLDLLAREARSRPRRHKTVDDLGAREVAVGPHDVVEPRPGFFLGRCWGRRRRWRRRVLGLRLSITPSAYTYCTFSCDRGPVGRRRRRNL